MIESLCSFINCFSSPFPHFKKSLLSLLNIKQRKKEIKKKNTQQTKNKKTTQKKFKTKQTNKKKRQQP